MSKCFGDCGKETILLNTKNVRQNQTFLQEKHGQEEKIIHAFANLQLCQNLYFLKTPFYFSRTCHVLSFSKLVLRPKD